MVGCSGRVAAEPLRSRSAAASGYGQLASALFRSNMQDDWSTASNADAGTDFS